MQESRSWETQVGKPKLGNPSWGNPSWPRPSWPRPSWENLAIAMAIAMAIAKCKICEVQNLRSAKFGPSQLGPSQLGPSQLRWANFGGRTSVGEPRWPNFGGRTSVAELRWPNFGVSGAARCTRDTCPDPHRCPRCIVCRRGAGHKSAHTCTHPRTPGRPAQVSKVYCV